MADAVTNQAEPGDGAGHRQPGAVGADPSTATVTVTTPVVLSPEVARKRDKTFRDMLLSVGLIAVVVLLFVGLNGGFTFSPGHPDDSAPAPTADAVGEFAKANRMVPFKPAVPKDLPGDWHANSAAITNPDTVAQGTPLSVRGGWLTPGGAFIALVATNAEPSALLRSEFDQASTDAGTVKAGDADWTVTTGVRSEVAWYRTAADGITYLITGNADELAFRALAASIAGA
ncbi:DUF4245 domain-containing protein [Nakamurella lactea]|uniref:DUF4245 domain-containing protein n=1 Tax=Nakamurella lactea TaxID=459515 RepID=UPI00040EA603|nr:DUF4245 domain-containing protein [Nakamurella lactea]